MAVLGFISCKKVAEPDSVNPPVVVNKIAPDGFNYTTTKEIAVTITALTNRNKPITGVPVQVYSIKNGVKGSLLFKGVTNAQGIISSKTNLPA